MRWRNKKLQRRERERERESGRNVRRDIVKSGHRTAFRKKVFLFSMGDVSSLEYVKAKMTGHSIRPVYGLSLDSWVFYTRKGHYMDNILSLGNRIIPGRK